MMINQQQKIYTTGYTGKNIENLPELLKSLAAVLIDVRFSPQSRQSHWSGDHLKRLLGKRYLHVQALGNRSFREGAIAIQNMRLGMSIVKKLKIDAVLMCGCEKLHQCHRLLIYNAFQKGGFETQELDAWELSKPSLF